MKKSIFAFAVAMTASMLCGDVLYWQVSEQSGVKFNAATLYATAATSATDGNAVGSYVDQSTALGIMSTPVIGSNIDNLDSYAGFYVGLYKYTDGNWQLAGTSRWLSLNDVATALEKSSLEGQFIQAHSSVATFIPEPTSGILMLLGVAGLALRRRRKV